MAIFRTLTRIVLLAISACVVPVAGAADVTSPIRIVVPFGAGGATDILARLIAPKLAEVLKQPVIVDNKGGAGSRVGTLMVARAAPDGLTVLLADTAFTANPSLSTKLTYDPVNDFAPVALLATAPVYLVVHPSLPAANLREFVDLGKRTPLQSASVGTGSATTLAGYQLATTAGIKIQEVPYKGAGPAMGDVLSGTVPIIFIGISSVKSLISAGKLRALAVSGSTRAAAMPGIPTFAEQGVAGVNASSYWGALVPAGTPHSVVDRLTAAMTAVVRMPDVEARLHELGFAPQGGTPDQYRTNIQTEIERWAAFSKATGVRMED